MCNEENYCCDLERSDLLETIVCWTIAVNNTIDFLDLNEGKFQEK